MNLDEYVLQEIFALQDFRDWWRIMGGKEPLTYRYENKPEEWPMIFDMYKKYKTGEKK
jgi:hypothetical protein